VSRLSGHPGVGPDDPGSSTGFLSRGVSSRPGEVQLMRAGPDDPGALPDDPGRSNCSRFPLEDEFAGGMDDFGAQIEEISWIEGGQNWGDARST